MDLVIYKYPIFPLQQNTGFIPRNKTAAQCGQGSSKSEITLNSKHGFLSLIWNSKKRANQDKTKCRMLRIEKMFSKSFCNM